MFTNLPLHSPLVNGLTCRWSFRSADDRFRDPAEGHPHQPLVSRVLAARGIASSDAATFLDPRLTQLHDPSLIPHLDAAAERILTALRRAEPIAIYGDYDVDGITATAILYHLFKALAPDAPITTYVPHRVDEGYGLNAQALRELAATHPLIISVDCGVTAVEPALAAKNAGADLIITDHHHPPRSTAELPHAFAVVHPRHPQSSYPFADLCGAGVAYKLAWRIATLAAGGKNVRVAEPVRNLLVELLAFAALGTIADIVPLVGENRVIARFGLVRARHSPFVGLRALVEAAGLTDEKIGELEVGFRLGPRLNAAGRMGHAKEAVELFTTATPDRAREIAAHLSSQNDARRKVESEILDHACRLAEERGMTAPDRRAIVLAHESWNAGVVGIVCSRLVERFCRPTILMQTRDSSCHGSGRSIENFDLHAALAACSHHLDKFGGHTMAAGLHLPESRLEGFTSDFIAHCTANIPSDHLRPSVLIDCEAAPAELTPQTVAQLEALAPFGAGNPPVRVLVRNLKVLGQPKLLGGQGKHLSMQLQASHSSHTQQVFRAVAWNWGDHLERFPPGQAIDAVITPKISTWSGRSMVEPELRDVAIL